MPPEVIVGPGDDAAALLLPPDELCVTTTDSVIAGVHFDPETTAPESIGRKAVARCVSDLAAMAAGPIAVLGAAHLPQKYNMESAQKIVRGMLSAAEEIGVALIGGDIAVHEGNLSITVTAIGAAPPKRIVLRSGARKGDRVCVTGELGGSLLGHHLRFMPRTTEALWLAEHATLHAMIDISDGLLLDAWRIARDSQIGIVIDPILLPISSAAHEAAKSSGRTAVQHALGDGEDYELLFTVPRRAAKRLMALGDLPVRVTVIGEVVPEEGLWLKEENGARRPVVPAGWVHGFGMVSPTPTA